MVAIAAAGVTIQVRPLRNYVLQKPKYIKGCTLKLRINQEHKCGTFFIIVNGGISWKGMSGESLSQCLREIQFKPRFLARLSLIVQTQAILEQHLFTLLLKAPRDSVVAAVVRFLAFQGDSASSNDAESALQWERQIYVNSHEPSSIPAIVWSSVAHRSFKLFLNGLSRDLFAHHFDRRQTELKEFLDMGQQQQQQQPREEKMLMTMIESGVTSYEGMFGPLGEPYIEMWKTDDFALKDEEPGRAIIKVLLENDGDDSTGRSEISTWLSETVIEIPTKIELYADGSGLQGVLAVLTMTDIAKIVVVGQYIHGIDEITSWLRPATESWSNKRAIFYPPPDLLITKACCSVDLEQPRTQSSIATSCSLPRALYKFAEERLTLMNRSRRRVLLVPMDYEDLIPVALMAHSVLSSASNDLPSRYEVVIATPIAHQLPTYLRMLIDAVAPALRDALLCHGVNILHNLLEPPAAKANLGDVRMHLVSSCVEYSNLIRTFEENHIVYVFATPANLQYGLSKDIFENFIGPNPEAAIGLVNDGGNQTPLSCLRIRDRLNGTEENHAQSMETTAYEVSFSSQLHAEFMARLEVFSMQINGLVPTQKSTIPQSKDRSSLVESQMDFAAEFFDSGIWTSLQNETPDKMTTSQNLSDWRERAEQTFIKNLPRVIREVHRKITIKCAIMNLCDGPSDFPMSDAENCFLSVSSGVAQLIAQLRPRWVCVDDSEMEAEARILKKDGLEKLESRIDAKIFTLSAGENVEIELLGNRVTVCDIQDDEVSGTVLALGRHLWKHGDLLGTEHHDPQLGEAIFAVGGISPLTVCLVDCSDTMVDDLKLSWPARGSHAYPYDFIFASVIKRDPLVELACAIAQELATNSQLEIRRLSNDRGEEMVDVDGRVSVIVSRTNSISIKGKMSLLWLVVRESICSVFREASSISSHHQSWRFRADKTKSIKNDFSRKP